VWCLIETILIWRVLLNVEVKAFIISLQALLSLALKQNFLKYRAYKISALNYLLYLINEKNML